jgi:hypothetical protein
MNELTIQNQSGFAVMRETAELFANADIVPKAFQGNLGNCFIAIQLADRMKADPFLVMQNVDIIHGKPGFSSKFLIGCFNSCGRFSAIRYEHDDQDGGRTRACATELATGREILGPWVSMNMAKAEGWVSKNGSKWQTMPELMRSYRAAAFMIRVTAPEISLGLPTTEEVIDTGGAIGREVRDITPKTPFARAKAEPAPVVASVEVIEDKAPDPLEVIKGKLTKSGLKVAEALGALATLGIGDGKTPFSRMDQATLEKVASDWSTVEEVAGQLKATQEVVA